MRTAQDAGVNEHPQNVMRQLKIKYEHATPQSMHDGWQFWNCTDLPDLLPEYLRVGKWEPMDYIGYGLSKEVAEKLSE